MTEEFEMPIVPESTDEADSDAVARHHHHHRHSRHRSRRRRRDLLLRASITALLILGAFLLWRFVVGS